MKNKKTTGNISNISINFFIIREIFYIINNKSVTPNEFYIKLLGASGLRKKAKTGGKKAIYKVADIYANLVTRATVKASNYIDQITKYGFSETFFMDNEATHIVAPAICIDEIINFLSDREINDLKNIRNNIIIPYIFEYKNEDGTLIIDCVKRIIDEIVNERTDNKDSVNEVLEYIADAPCNVAISQKIIKDFYDQIGKSFEKGKIAYKNVQLPKVDSFNKNKRVYVTSNNEKIKQNLLLVREAFYLLASLDENEILIPYFYLYLDCTEYEYAEYIRNGKIPTRKLADKFQLFKFPATIFKGESPCDIDIVINNCPYYLNDNFDIDNENKMNEFRSVLRLALCYRIDTRNIPFFSAVYSMYEYIKMYAAACIEANLELAEGNVFPE